MEKKILLIKKNVGLEYDRLLKLLTMEVKYE